MKEIHPLKRKSIKPSSSTVRGMLPGPQFRALDAAMQSLRAAGVRLDWRWKDAKIGWVCVGLYEEQAACELRPTTDPLSGWMRLEPAQLETALSSPRVPARFKKILKVPISEDRNGSVYEFDLDTTPIRDLFSEFVEVLCPVCFGPAAA